MVGIFCYSGETRVGDTRIQIDMVLDHHRQWNLVIESPSEGPHGGDIPVGAVVTVSLCRHCQVLGHAVEQFLVVVV